MAEKKYAGAPFGTQTARFDVSGVHPNNKKPGTYTQIPYCKKATSDKNTRLGPGKYNVESQGDFSDLAVQERASGPGWARAYEVARMASLPHLLHKEQWELKKLLKRKLGPGSYNIKDFLETSELKPRSTHGIVQTRDVRFKDAIASEITPGPGTYGKGGVPHAAVEEKRQKSTSNIGMLDAGSSTPRTLPQVGSHLGPGNYNFNSFTDDMQKKVTSLRGPYDLFSGDRNKPIKTGHLAVPSNAKLGPGQYEIKSFTDDLVSEHQHRQGRFGKVDQFPEKPTERIYSFSLSQNPRKSSEPAPGTYDPSDPNVKPPAQAKKSPGFLSSAQRNDKMATKFFTGNFNPVGAGRYDVQRFEEAKHRNGHTSVFKSKSTRPDHTKSKFWHERIRGKDIQVKDRVFLVQPEHPNEHLMRTMTHIERSSMPPGALRSQRALTVAY